jgi:regulator of protease activity HflC (stomatin/prohibitin superfamily)
VYRVYSYYQDHPDQMVAITGKDLAKGGEMNEMCLLIGLACAGIYAALYWLTRPTRETEADAEATHGIFTLGIMGMTALGVSTLLGYFKVGWASETAAAVIAAFMLLQGLELLVNSFRSFSGIAELEYEPVDLQATPLTPMLESVWLGALRILLAQSLGLDEAKKGEKGVIGRIMPRTLLALVLLAIGISCIRVVPPGKVAILERLGYTPLEADGRRPTKDAIKGPGLHLQFPWPIDELVYIPTEQLQLVDVGTELHATGDWKNVDFQFWTIRPSGEDPNETDDLFITGDPGSPQFLETYVQVRWRVKDPVRFYAAMSHSNHIAKETEGNDKPSAAKVLPIYQEMVQQSTSFAVTRTFAIHTMEQILITQRAEAEDHCKRILQEKMDALCALPGETAGAATRGVEVVYVTIKDLHPPFWHADRQVADGVPSIGGRIMLNQRLGKFELVSTPESPSKVSRGPASAFELVVSMRELREQLINYGQLEAIKTKNEAHGEALAAISDAKKYASETIAKAHGEADQLVAMTSGMTPEQLSLMKRRAFFETFKDAFNPVQKVVVDPDAKDVQIYQMTEKGAGARAPN